MPEVIGWQNPPAPSPAKAHAHAHAHANAPEPIRRRTLLDIDDDLRALDDLIGELDGEITDTEATVDTWFAELRGDRNRKLDGYVTLIRERELLEAARTAEIDRLQARRKADQNKLAFLKNRLLAFMQSQGAKTIETDRYRFTAATAGGLAPLKLHCEPEQLPAEFRREKLVVSPNADAIRKALAEGQELTFAEIAERSKYLKIS